MVDDLSQFDFTDCLVLSFGVENDARRLSLSFEAVMPAETPDRMARNVVLMLTLQDCTDVSIQAHPELWVDLQRPYRGGATDKANEILALRLTFDANQAHLHLKSNMLMLSATARQARVEQAQAPD
jgi:hypothetical protein